jgi:hypothetical protein
VSRRELTSTGVSSNRCSTTRPGAWLGVHQADIQSAFDQAPHQVLLETDLAADGNVASRITHPTDPAGWKSLPQGDSSSDANRGAVPAWQTNMVPGLFHREHEALGVLEKAAPGRGQAGAGSVPPEQPGAEIGLQALDSGANRGLGPVQPAGGFQKTAVGGNGKKSASLLDIHNGAQMVHTVCSYR